MESITKQETPALLVPVWVKLRQSDCQDTFIISSSMKTRTILLIAAVLLATIAVLAVEAQRKELSSKDRKKVKCGGMFTSWLSPQLVAAMLTSLGNQH